MKKTLLTLSALAVFSAGAYAQQLSGVKTINPNGSGADNYIGFRAAVDSLKKYGVGEGGVTFNVAPVNYAERIVIDSAVTAGASETKQIIFQKDPAATTNPIFRASSTTGIAGEIEFVRIANASWVTFDGIDFQAQGDGTAAANTVAAIRFTAIQNCTFKNFTVRGSGLYNARGINSGDFNATVANLKGRRPSRYVTIENVRVVNVPTRCIQFFADYTGADGTDLNQLQQVNRDRYNKVINCTIDSSGLQAGTVGTVTSSQGMLLLGQDSMTVTGNTITNTIHTPTTVPAAGNYHIGILLRSNPAQGHATGNVISNNTYSGGYGTEDIFGFGLWRNVGSTAENNTIENIEAKSVYGIYNIGLNTTLNVSKNKVMNLTGLTGDCGGILVGGDSLNSVYSENVITNLRSDATTEVDVLGFDIQSVIGASIVNNKISKIYAGETSQGLTPAGIRTSAAIARAGRPTGGDVYVANNFISQVYQAVADNDLEQGTNGAYGIRSINFVDASSVRTTGGSQHIYHNTIVLNRPADLTADIAHAVTGALLFGNVEETDSVFFANNIVVDANTHADDADTSFIITYIGGAELITKGNNYVGINGTNKFAAADTNAVYPYLADWLMAGNDMMTDSVAVTFVDEANGDLHLVATDYANIALRKSRLAWVAKDIDGTDRASENTQVGADAQDGEQNLNPVAVKNNLKAAKSLVVFPNPTRENARFAMNVEKATTATITVRNLMGQTVATKNVNLNAGANTAGINVADLSSGIYVYSVAVNGNVFTGKFIKE